MPPSFPLPTQWTREELLVQRSVAERVFVEQRRDEGPRAYALVYAEIEPQIREAFAKTDDLRALSAETFLADPGLWQVLRYCCAPLISEEDLWTMVGRKFTRVPSDLVEDTALALRPL